MPKLKLPILLLSAELLFFCTSKVQSNTEFAECFNTSTEIHCFSKIVSGVFNFTEAQKFCGTIDATLPVIKSDDVQKLFELFIDDMSNATEVEDSIIFFWTNARRVVDTKWHWLNTSVINELDSTGALDYFMHVGSLGLERIGGEEVQLIANYPGETLSYICEFFGNDSQCNRGDENILQYGDKCYVVSKDDQTWYDARNRCLKDGGDLASFGDLKTTHINFNQWLDLSIARQYWVGARYVWWSWGYPDNEEARYTSWYRNYPVPLFNIDECLSVYGNSGIDIQIEGWKTEDCTNFQSVGVICHKVTSLEDFPTDSKSSTRASNVNYIASDVMPRSTATVGTESELSTRASNESGSPIVAPNTKSSSTGANIIPLAVGIGLGVGIPVVVALVVIGVVLVRRKKCFSIHV